MVLALAALFAAAALLVAVTIPFHLWDALAYGEWSRRIALTGNFHFPDVGALDYQRPFYYVLQGWVWRIFGFDERLGRLLALAFAIVLAVAVHRLARRASGWTWAGTLALLVLLVMPDLARYAASGLSDVPVAAMVAVSAALVWGRTPGRLGWPLTLAAAGAAALTKPSALFALSALAVAQLVGPRAELRSRLLGRTAPIGLGIALALVYDVLEAHRLHLSLAGFLKTGISGPYYAHVADLVRRQTGFGLDWLGPDLRLLLAFALLYAVVRVAGAAHRPAVVVAAPAAIVAAWLGPWIAVREATVAAGPFTGPGRAVPFAVLAATLFFALAAPPAAVPERTTLARLLVWTGPAIAMWLVYVPYSSQYLSPAWPGLVVLTTVTAAPALAGAARRAPLAVVPVLAVLAALVLSNLREIDGLGDDGWTRFRAAGVSGWFDQARMRRLVMGSFTEELDLTRAHVDAGRERVFSSDGRLKFYFPGRVTQAYPRACSDLRGYGAFVLLLDPISASYLERNVGVPATTRFWASCSAPRLTLVGGRPSEFAVFAVARS